MVFLFVSFSFFFETMLSFWNGFSWTIWISARCKGAILPLLLLVAITQQALCSHSETGSVIIGFSWGYSFISQQSRLVWALLTYPHRCACSHTQSWGMSRNLWLHHQNMQSQSTQKHCMRMNTGHQGWTLGRKKDRLKLGVCSMSSESRMSRSRYYTSRLKSLHSSAIMLERVSQQCVIIILNA